MEAVFAAAFWLAAWQAVAAAVGNSIALVGPLETAQALYSLAGHASFWRSCLQSASHVALGLFLSFPTGIALGAAAFRFKTARRLSEPIILAMSSVPVASFVILALIVVGSRWLAVPICAVVVLPQAYSAALNGAMAADSRLDRFAKMLGIPLLYRIFAIFRPAMAPLVASAAKTSVGLAWKSSVAAEVLGISAGTLGEGMYMSKVYLETASLFAYTLAVIVLSAAMEKAALSALGLAFRTKMPYRAPLRRKAAPSGAASVEALGASKSFGGKPVFAGLHFAVAAGQTACVLGPSGAGKSTLIEAICGLESLDSGEIRFGGAQGASAALQDDLLFESLTAAENMRLLCGPSEKEFAEKLESLVGPSPPLAPVSALSGGMKRRAAVARALLAPSGCVVLDEPFSGLDEGSRIKTAEFIKRELGGRTLIYTAHDDPDPILGCDVAIRL
jgi:NitT/TauT family transport system permease protein